MFTEQGNIDVAIAASSITALIDPTTGLVDDLQVVEKLAKEHGICVLPGSACGAPGYIRVGYANLPPEQVLVQTNRGVYGVAQVGYSWKESESAEYEDEFGHLRILFDHTL